MKVKHLPEPSVFVIYALYLISSVISQHHLKHPHAHKSSESSGSHQHYRPQRPTHMNGPDVTGTAANIPGHAQKLTEDTKLLQDTEHIKEDLGDVFTEEETKNMTPEELEFHYFKLHDFDNNTKLDGLEILQAISHIVTWDDDADKPDKTHEQEMEAKKKREDDFNYYVELIDKVLEEDDLDKDGYLSYLEYILGRKRDEKDRSKQTTNKEEHR